MILTTAPATSVSVPKLVTLFVTPVIVEVPVFVMFPLARGVPEVGRMRTFCHVREHVTPLELAVVTEKVICEAVTEPTAADVPLATPLILRELLPDPPTRVMSTVGAMPPVSNSNPVGALRMIVPTAAFPEVDSV